MPSTCTFEFDRAEPVYYSGETVEGRIVLSTTKEKKFKAIYIQFKGEAKVRWAISKAFHLMKKRLHHTVTYQGQETYIQSRETLRTPPPDTLPAGVHIYTFSFALPAQLPSSSEEAFGQITYEITLVIDREEHFNNIFRQPLTVLRQVDLNESAELLEPIEAQDRFYFRCWPFKSGPVKSKLTIPFGGYASGQHIHFTLYVHNKSKVLGVKGIKLRLVQTYTIMAQTPRLKKRVHQVKLSETQLDEVVPPSTEGVIRSFLTVPAVPPTTQGDFIVSIAYHIEMVFGAICRSFSKIVLPVTIGTIPLTKSLEIPTTTLDRDLNQPPCCGPIRLVSYEEVKNVSKRFTDTDMDEHSRFYGFSPKYPMYRKVSLTHPATYLDSRSGSLKRGSSSKYAVKNK